ncbi:cytochrome c oxidase subunit II [Altererythrobacter indicus]|uniref:Cytochrome c oxidase subunit 2 n=1 Tax=Altericroceibacterium indicum TaxID=374177 RepID=A0A845A5E5_9SPHN|nr:cytochrome c oxidase subunit II [Altericroceibacterium indicum]
MALAQDGVNGASEAMSVGQADARAANVADDSIPAAQAAEGQTVEPAAGAEAYKPLGPEWIKGQPESGKTSFQKQYSDIGEYGLWMHNAVLLPVITAITLLVLGLILWVIARYNRRRSPVASKSSHNTLIEIIWTILPVLILFVIAIPSITLLVRQYESPPKDALTVKVTGYQWYWGYSYPDNGGFEVISNMLDDEEAVKRGLPPKLAVDNRLVVPAGEPIRIQTTGADVIHSFAVPSLWFKLDAVPGRLNERQLTIKEPGIYYGQCSELCGVRHGYMPIAIEALPRPQFDAWVRAQGGTVGGEASDAKPAAADLQEPESSVEGAPGAGAPPTQLDSPAADAEV